MLKIYPSSYAPAAGQSTNSTYNSGCLRYQAYKHLLPRGNIHPLYQALGAIGEEYALSRIPDPKEREVPVTYEFGEAQISGRIDCLTDDCVYEFKTSTNKAKAAQIRSGKFDENHIGQLVTYMAILNRTTGCLVSMYAHFSKDFPGLRIIKRDYEIKIKENNVYVDGVLYRSVAEILQFYTNHIAALTNRDTALPPINVNEKACTYCPMADVCFMAQTPDEFKEGLKEVQPTPILKDPKISTHTMRDEKVNYSAKDSEPLADT